MYKTFIFGENNSKSRKISKNRIKSITSIPFGGPIGISYRAIMPPMRGSDGRDVCAEAALAVKATGTGKQAHLQTWS